MLNDTPNIITAPATPDSCIQSEVRKKRRKKNETHNENHSKARTITRKVWIVPPLQRCNSDHDVEGQSINGFYGLLVVAIVIVAPFSATILPVNNVFTNPEYWYEIIISTSSTFLCTACTCAFEVVSLMRGIIKKPTWQVALEFFLQLEVIATSTFSLIHLIWSKIFGFYEPFPIRGIATISIATNAILARFWYIIPKEIRIDPQIRKRCIALVCYGIWTRWVGFQLSLLINSIKKAPRDFQWIAALIIPLTKEVNDRIIIMTTTRATSIENTFEAKCIGKIVNNMMYSYLFATCFASHATKTTEYVLLGLNFVIDMQLCFKAIRLHRKVSEDNTNTKAIQQIKTEILTDLVLNEVAEVIVPIGFIGTFVMAYYGPNNDLICNAGCTLWHHKKIENLLTFLMPVAEMALIDSGSVILAGFLLFQLCRINLWRIYCETIRKYWILFAFQGATMISTVSILDTILCKNMIKQF